MIIVWRGLGLLVLFVTLGCCVGANLLANKFLGDGYWEHNGWPFAAGIGAAGAICWLLGRRLNRTARRDANPRRPWTHDLFWLRMEWWSFPLVAAAAYCLVTGWKPGDAPQTVKAAAQQTQRVAPTSK